MSLGRFLRELTVNDLGRILTFRRPLRGAAAPPLALLLATGPGTPEYNLRCAHRTLHAVLFAHARSVIGAREVSDAELAALALHAAEHLERFATQMIAADVEIDVPDYVPDDLTGGSE